MNHTGKLDLDGLLRSWPAPSPSDELEWDQRAERMIKTAQARPPASEAELSALLAAPPLEPEPGEPGEEPARAHVRHSGETKMSQGSDRDEMDKPEAEPRSSMPSVAPGKKRSLKEIAERASQAGLAGPTSRTSVIPTPVPSRPSGISTPIPPPLATPIPSRPGSMPPSRAGEAQGEDSGLINLKAVTEPPPPPKSQTQAAPEGAQPLTTEMSFGDDAAPASAEATAQQRAAVVPLAAKKKGSGGVVAGAAIAAVGLAAAFAIMMTRNPTADQPSQPIAQAPAEQQKQAEPQAAAQQPAAAPVAAAPEQPAGTDPDALPDAEKTAEGGKVAQAPAAGAAATPPAGQAPAGQQAVAQATPPADHPTVPGTPAKPGDLNSAMQQAVGSDGKPVTTEAPEPAAGKPLNQSVPEQPPQGAAAAAIRSAMPGAKACVAGADDVTRAQVTFNSSGAVSNVSVSGWAASNGQTGCVKAALQGANVGPFSKPSFMMPVTIRP